MIQIFGLLFFIILICLIYLYYQKKISYNIPIIFMFFLIIIIPFTYLESNKMNIESYSNYDQIMNSSLDIFFTNENSDKKRMDMLKKVKLINNPIQTILVQKAITPITFYIVTIDNVNSAVSYIYLYNKENNINIYTNYTNQIVAMTYITKDELFNKNYNSIKTRLKEYDDITNLKNDITAISVDAYIIVIGNNMSLFVNADPNVITYFINNYKFSWLNNLSSSTGSFISILGRTTTNNITSYTSLSDKYTSSNNFLVITQNLTPDMTLANQYGEEFESIATSEDFEPITSNPLINSKINIISPAVSNLYSTLSFTFENNTSFVYLSSQELKDQVILYSKSPRSDIGPVSDTYLNTETPQFWSFEPVSQINTSPIIVFIRTYTKPYYYLDADINNGIVEVKISRLKAGLRQHWELIKDGIIGTKYKIRHVLHNRYIAYSNYDGYLYKDTGSVFFTLSNDYSWNITGLNTSQINKNVIESFTPNMSSSMKNSFQGMEVPTDFGTVKNPSYKLSGNVNGKDIVIESKGRTLWESSYSPIWNGKWIYYGTVTSYKATLDLNKVKFLVIKVDNNGNGQIEDEYLNYKMKVINAGSNILTGIIPSGQYAGFRAIFNLLPTDLKYTNPSEPYPVKMRYFIEKDKKRYNLSSGNIYNMEGYSTKFDGNKMIMSNFLEASGIQTNPNLAFSPANLQKINADIKKQTSMPSIIQKVSNLWMTNPIKSVNLLYQASSNGWGPATFQQLCSGKGPTITIATLVDGRIIGAYSPISWGINTGYINSMETFLFDNDNKYTTNDSSWGPGQYAIYQGATFGPTFGGGFDFGPLDWGESKTLDQNAFTYSNNGKGPLGVMGPLPGVPSNYSYNNYSLKDLEVYSITT